MGVTPKRLITGRRQHSPPWDLIGRDNPSLTLTPSGVSRGGGQPWGPAASVVSHSGLAAPADPRRQRGEPQGRGRRGGGLLSHCLSPGISSAFVWGDTSCRGGCVCLLALLCSPKSQPLLPATLALSFSVTLIHLSSGRPPSLSVTTLGAGSRGGLSQALRPSCPRAEPPALHPDRGTHSPAPRPCQMSAPPLPRRPAARKPPPCRAPRAHGASALLSLQGQASPDPRPVRETRPHYAHTEVTRFCGRRDRWLTVLVCGAVLCDVAGHTEFGAQPALPGAPAHTPAAGHGPDHPSWQSLWSETTR